nr:uncharacterized protein LOC124808103 [Hydra vulgaris]
MADDDEDGFPGKSARTRNGRSTVREKNEENFLVTTRFRSPPPMRYTSPRASRDCQPGTSSTSFNISLALQRIIGVKEQSTYFSIHYICLHQTDYPHWEKFVVEYIGSEQVRITQNYPVHKRQCQDLCFALEGSVRKVTGENLLEYAF